MLPVQAVDDVGGGDRVPSQNFTPGRSVNTILVGDGFATVARPGPIEPSGACRSSDSHISEIAVFSG